MTPARPTRRGAPRPVRALIALVVVALATLVTVPVAPGGAQEATPDEVTLRGLDLSTWVGPEGTWVFDLAVEGAPPGASIGAAVYEELPDRGAFDAALFGVVDGDQLATIPAIDLDPAIAAPGGGTAARLSLTLDSDQTDRRRAPPPRARPGDRGVPGRGGGLRRRRRGRRPPGRVPDPGARASRPTSHRCWWPPSCPSEARRRSTPRARPGWTRPPSPRSPTPPTGST